MCKVKSPKGEIKRITVIRKPGTGSYSLSAFYKTGLEVPTGSILDFQKYNFYKPFQNSLLRGEETSFSVFGG